MDRRELIARLPELEARYIELAKEKAEIEDCIEDAELEESEGEWCDYDADELKSLYRQADRLSDVLFSISYEIECTKSELFKK